MILIVFKFDLKFDDFTKWSQNYFLKDALNKLQNLIEFSPNFFTCHSHQTCDSKNQILSLKLPRTGTA